MIVADATKEIISGLLAIQVVCKPCRIPTYWVDLAYVKDQPPQQLLDALEKIGFCADKHFVGSSAYQDPKTGVPIQEVSLGHLGNGPFFMWTEDDCRRYTKQLRRVLSKFGIEFAPRTLSVHELL